jgi:hypothetical protein
MGDNKYFREALSDFAFDAAYGDSIRHLHDSGYTPEQIREYLNTEALTVQRIQEVIDNHKLINNDCDYEIVKEYDSYGRSSFVRKKKEEKSS